MTSELFTIKDDPMTEGTSYVDPIKVLANISKQIYESD